MTKINFDSITDPAKLAEIAQGFAKLAAYLDHRASYLRHLDRQDRESADTFSRAAEIAYRRIPDTIKWR